MLNDIPIHIIKKIRSARPAESKQPEGNEDASGRKVPQTNNTTMVPNSPHKMRRWFHLGYRTAAVIVMAFVVVAADSSNNNNNNNLPRSSSSSPPPPPFTTATSRSTAVTALGANRVRQHPLLSSSSKTAADRHRAGAGVVQSAPQDYRNDASRLFNTIRIPATVLAVAAASSAFAVHIQRRDTVRVGIAKRLYYLCMVGATASHSIALVVATVTGIELSTDHHDGDQYLTSTIHDLLHTSQYFKLEWLAVRVHYWLGIGLFLLGVGTSSRGAPFFLVLSLSPSFVLLTRVYYFFRCHYILLRAGWLAGWLLPVFSVPGIRAYISIACPIIAKSAMGIVVSALLVCGAFVSKTQRHRARYIDRQERNIPLTYLQTLIETSTQYPIFGIALVLVVMTKLYIVYHIPHIITNLLAMQKAGA